MDQQIPFAAKYRFGQMRTHGKYAGGYPKGAIVHYTAGAFAHGIGDAKAAIDLGITNRYAYLCIGRDGSLVQAHPVDQWGYHAGESAWRNATVGKLVGTVSDDLIGIEMCNAGILTKIKDGRHLTAWKAFIPAEQVRYVEEKDYGCPTGSYHAYSAEQEATLVKTLLWLKHNDPGSNFSFDDVLAHHEVAGKRGIGYFRKSDPGGALSMSMDHFRQHLKDLYAKSFVEPQPEKLP